MLAVKIHVWRSGAKCTKTFQQNILDEVETFISNKSSKEFQMILKLFPDIELQNSCYNSDFAAR